MKWAALIAWVLTAGGGFVLLTIWLSRGGMQQQREGGNRIRPPLILSHFLLAATGLVIWIIYLAADKDVLKWIAFAILAVVALLGWTMFAIWWRRRPGRRAVRDAAGCLGEPLLGEAACGNCLDDRPKSVLDRLRSPAGAEEQRVRACGQGLDGGRRADGRHALHVERIGDDEALEAELLPQQ